MNRLFLRTLAPWALLLGLALVPASAHAQVPPPDPNMAPGAAQEETGEPLYGYLGTAFLAAGAIFVVCKSARR